MNLTPCVLTLGVLVLSPARSESQHHQHASPYKDFLDREIKALSAEEIQGLRQGGGMGFALPAELHGYPGPRHVLDLADEVELTSVQRVEIEEIFHAMDARARRLGAEIIELERRLDQAFAQQWIGSQDLRELVTEIGARKSELRTVHLQAHLELRPLLTEEQRARYAELRGYARHR